MTDVDDTSVFDELNDRIENPPVSWMPGAEDPPEGAVTDPKIVGIVQQAELRTSDYGQYPYVVVRTADGQRVAIHGFGAVLKSKLTACAVGDGLAIAHLGKRPAKTQGYQDYDDYAVEIISRGGTPPSHVTRDSADLPDFEVEPGVFLSELEPEILQQLAETGAGPVLKARAAAWLLKVTGGA